MKNLLLDLLAVVVILAFLIILIIAGAVSIQIRATLIVTGCLAFLIWAACRCLRIYDRYRR